MGCETHGREACIWQQAALHSAESDFFFLEHSLAHFFGFPPLHALAALFWSFFLHVFVLLSAAQSSGDGAVERALPLFIPGADSIFTGVVAGRVSGGVTAPTQFSTRLAFWQAGCCR